MCSSSAPSSGMHWEDGFSQATLTAPSPSYPWKIALVPPGHTQHSSSSYRFRLGPTVKTAWLWEAAILSCQTRFRFRSFLSSPQLPRTWTHPKTLTEVSHLRGWRLWPLVDNRLQAGVNSPWQRLEGPGRKPRAKFGTKVLNNGKAARIWPVNYVSSVAVFLRRPLISQSHFSGERDNRMTRGNFILAISTFYPFVPLTWLVVAWKWCFQMDREEIVVVWDGRKCRYIRTEKRKNNELCCMVFALEWSSPVTNSAPPPLQELFVSPGLQRLDLGPTSCVTHGPDEQCSLTVSFCSFPV